jgi:hypothetical protein
MKKINKKFLPRDEFTYFAYFAYFALVITLLLTNYKGQSLKSIYFALLRLTSPYFAYFGKEVTYFAVLGTICLFLNDLQQRSKRSKRSKQNVFTFSEKKCFFN